jgi:hypothetical protein
MRAEEELNIKDELYRRMVVEQYSDVLILLETSECGLRLNDATGNVVSVLISGTSCGPTGGGWDLRLMDSVGERSVLDAPTVASTHTEFYSGTDDEAQFAVSVGYFDESSFRATIGGGSSFRHVLRYAEIDGVVYGTPVISSGGTPPVQSPFALSVAPNPFRSSSVVALTLPAEAAVTVAAYDALGRRVLARDLGRLGAGRHMVGVEGTALAPGVYVVRVTAGEEMATTRLVRVE